MTHRLPGDGSGPSNFGEGPSTYEGGEEGDGEGEDELVDDDSMASTVEEDDPDECVELEAESREQLQREENFDSSHLTEGYDAVVDMTTIFS